MGVVDSAFRNNAYVNQKLSTAEKTTSNLRIAGNLSVSGMEISVSGH
jgi:hypothetical protein